MSKQKDKFKIEYNKRNCTVTYSKQEFVKHNCFTLALIGLYECCKCNGIVI